MELGISRDVLNYFKTINYTPVVSTTEKYSLDFLEIDID